MAKVLYLFGRGMRGRHIAKEVGLTESVVSKMKRKKIITFEEFKTNAIFQ